MCKISNFVPIFFLFTLSAPLLNGMNKGEKGKEKEKKTYIEPHHTIDVFSVKKNLQTDRRRLEKLIACSLAISPSKKNLIIGAEGEVYQLSLNHTNPTLQNGGFKMLFKHPDVIYSPILALTQEKNSDLLIASAGNYEDTDTKEYKAHLTIHKPNGWLRQKIFNYPVQAIKFNKQGNLLAIGGHSSITLFDIDKDCITNNIFTPAFKGNPLQDISITQYNKKVQCVISISKNRSIQYHTITQSEDSYGLTLYPEVFCEDKLTHIHCANNNETILQTEDNTIKSISIENIFATINSEQKTLHTHTIDDTKNYENVTLNTDSHCAFARWTKNDGTSDKKRHRIEVFFIHNDHNVQKPTLDKCILKAPQCEKEYKLLSSSGKVELHYEHFFNVAFFGNRIVALSSCGKLFIWKLPIFNKDTEKQQISCDDIRPVLKRQRSKSLTILPATNNTSETEIMRSSSDHKHLKRTAAGLRITLSRTPSPISPQESPRSSSGTPKSSPRRPLLTKATQSESDKPQKQNKGLLTPPTSSRKISPRGSEEKK